MLDKTEENINAGPEMEDYERKKETHSKSNLKSNIVSKNNFDLLDNGMLQCVKRCFIKIIQWKYFKDVLKILKRNTKGFKPITVTKNQQFEHYLDENGLLRVRRRIGRSSINDECEHPIIFSKIQVSKLIVPLCHKKTEHPGGGITLNKT